VRKEERGGRWKAENKGRKWKEEGEEGWRLESWSEDEREMGLKAAEARRRL
jgi:hypothetical protein